MLKHLIIYVFIYVVVYAAVSCSTLCKSSTIGLKEQREEKLRCVHILIRTQHTVLYGTSFNIAYWSFKKAWIIVNNANKTLTQQHVTSVALSRVEIC